MGLSWGGIDMTSERLLLKYVRDILHAKSIEELKDIDRDVTYDDNVSTTGYAIIMNVINIKEEVLK